MPAAASAPGKVVLCGEYAVLDGAPAISMAIDRRARARVQLFDGDWHRIVAPGYTDVEGRFRIRDGRIEWRRGEREYSLVQAIFDVTKAAPEATLSIELDTRDFHDHETGEKLGLGSSAALTVALLATLLPAAEVFQGAIEAHRHWQRGTGSGVDVATAVQGGLVEYRMTDRTITPLAWPGGLHCRVLWSGASSSTREKLARYATAEDHESRKRLASAAHDMANAWRSGADVLQAFPAYIDVLRRFSVDHGLGIFDSGHAQLVSEAEAAGLVYKPCGAGGGDIGVLLGASAAELDDFIRNGKRMLDCSFEAVGVNLERH